MDNNVKLYQVAWERAKTMTRLSTFSSVAAIGFAVLVLSLGTIWDRYAGSDTFSIGFPVYCVAALFSLASLIYGLLAAAAGREEIEKIELEKRKETSHHAFNVDEDVRFTSGRAFANYKKYAPFVITILAAVLLLAMLAGYASYWQNIDRIKAAPKNTMQALITAILLMCCSGFIGAFYIGQARTKTFRWLRAVGAWYIMGFLIMFAAAVELCLVHFNISGFEAYFSWTCLGVLTVLAVELIINFIVDFYRPRTIEEVRPMFESSLLSLFTEPGGVMRNIADTLDYQFGFKVSGTFIYGFVERSLFPALVIWAVVLWLFTCIDQVGPGQLGLKERCGKLVSTEPLTPDIYFKLPWPFESISRYNCTELREVVVGDDHSKDHAHEEEEEEVDDGHGHSHAKPKDNRAELEAKYKHVVFWDMHEDDAMSSYMIAVKTDGVQDTSGLPTNIAFINATFPIQYQIRPNEILKYALHNQDPEDMLRLIGESVVTEYMASALMMQVMATDRMETANIIKGRIQAAADQLDLGIEVVNVAMIDVHPAPPVVKAFQDVISAQEEMRTNMLAAEIDRVSLLPQSQAYANELVVMAEAYSASQKLIANADAERFGKQLEAYNELPALFKLRSYLDLLEKETGMIRKYIISSSIKQEVFELNFEESAGFDFGNVDLGK